jgi:NAD(P)-dependent dehydrogenase (short-subunit alcohol dehydrogenase family)
VTDPDAVDSAAELAGTTLGGVELVVHPAGASVGCPVLDATPAESTS